MPAQSTGEVTLSDLHGCVRRLGNQGHQPALERSVQRRKGPPTLPSANKWVCSAPAPFFLPPPLLPLLSGCELGQSHLLPHATSPSPAVGNPGPRAKEGAASSSLFTASKTDLWPAHKGPLWKPLPPESTASAPSGQAPDKQAFGNCLESHLPACAPTWPPAILPHTPLGRPPPRQGLPSLTGAGQGGTSASAPHEPNPDLPPAPLMGNAIFPISSNYLEGRGGVGRLCVYLPSSEYIFKGRENGLSDDHCPLVMPCRHSSFRPPGPSSSRRHTHTLCGCL